MTGLERRIDRIERILIIMSDIDSTTSDGSWYSCCGCCSDLDGGHDEGCLIMEVIREVHEAKSLTKQES